AWPTQQTMIVSELKAQAGTGLSPPSRTGFAALIAMINAGKIPVTELPGAAYFHHADSFAMMRGGHLDICVLGAFQVSSTGDLANWHTGAPDAIPAVGGAMDLAIGAKRVFVMMTLFTKQGTPKLVPEYTYPLTGIGCIDRVYTDFATFEVGPAGTTVLETFGMSYADLARRLEVGLPRQDEIRR
ncbi:CoA-transferase, partial [Streptomyces sp. NPDC002143]